MYQTYFDQNNHNWQHSHRNPAPAQNILELGIGSRQFFSALEKALPPVFTRKTASEVIGGLISAKTMSNADALGRGPRERVRVGNRVGYTRDSFLEWLAGKVRTS